MKTVIQALVWQNIQNDDSLQLGTIVTANSIKLMASINQIVIVLSNGNSFSFTELVPTADRIYTIPDGRASNTLALQNALEYLKVLNAQFPSYAVTIESSLAGMSIIAIICMEMAAIIMGMA